MRLLLLLPLLILVGCDSLTNDTEIETGYYCDLDTNPPDNRASGECRVGDRLYWREAWLFEDDVGVFVVSPLTAKIARWCDHTQEIIVTKATREEVWDEVGELYSVSCIYKPVEYRTIQTQPKWEDAFNEDGTPK